MTLVHDDPEIRWLLHESEPFVLQADATVSESSIKAWCGALEDRNPAYLDNGEALRLGHSGVMAPPVMMHSFTLPTLLNPEGPSPAKRLRERMGKLGFPGVAAVNYEQEYAKPIRLGDRLTRTVTMGELSDAKVTALGAGHFFSTLHRITNQDDELVGTMLIRVFYFDSAGAKPRAIKAPSPAAADSVAIPPKTIPVTATLVAAGAIATLDLEPVHHDRQTAINQGMRDIFMNILTSSGLSMSYAADWAGHDVRMKRISVRLHSPNFPGDTMVMTGQASQQRRAGDTATIKVTGANSTGKHVEAEIEIEWPAA